MIGSLADYRKRQKERGLDPMELGSKYPFFQSIYMRIGGSVLSGLLLALAFPGAGISLLAFAALIPLMFAVQSVGARRAAWLGLISGFVFYMLSLGWLHNLPGVVDSVGLKICGVLGYVGLALYCALYIAAFTVIANLGIRQWVGDHVLKNIRFLFMASTVWVGLEYLRSVLFSGFPWNALGISQYTSPTMIQVAQLGGVYIVSAVVVWMNMALYITLRQYTHGTRMRKYRVHLELMSGLVPIALSMMYGMNVGIDRSRMKPHESVRVGIVQPNIKQTLKNAPSETSSADEMWTRLWELSYAVNHAPCATGEWDLDLVVWPETALPEYLHTPSGFSGETISQRLVNKVVDEGAPLLVGTLDFAHFNGEQLNYNSSILIAENGNELAKYDKRHLVPFGEYVPIKGLRKFTAVDGNFSPGTEATVFPLPDIQNGIQRAEFSVLICFEDIVAPLAAESVRNGARWLVNQTNDGWFDPSSQSEQHLAHAVFRCVENEVPMVRCCNTGVSCHIDSFGNVHSRIEPMTKGYSVAQVIPREEGKSLTFYTRRGDLFAWSCLLLSASTISVFGINAFCRRKKRV